MLAAVIEQGRDWVSVAATVAPSLYLSLSLSHVIGWRVAVAATVALSLSLFPSLSLS